MSRSKVPLLSPKWFLKERKPGARVRVETTPEAIDMGICGNPDWCPINIAIRLALGYLPNPQGVKRPHVRVDSNGTHMAAPPGPRYGTVYHFGTPQKALIDLCQYDAVGQRDGEAAAKAQMKPTTYTFRFVRKTTSSWMKMTPEERIIDNEKRNAPHRAPRSKQRRKSPAKRYTGVTMDAAAEGT